MPPPRKGLIGQRTAERAVRRVVDTVAGAAVR
jgi:hypothetical protein